MDYDYRLEILGNPRPQGRPRGRNMGKFIHIYEDPKDAKAKRSIEKVIQDEAPEKLLDCPLKVDMDFYFIRSKGHFGTGRNAGKIKSSAPEYHTKTPDIDNLRKLTMDALTGIFWRDDSLVCQGLTTKQYSNRPRTVIYIKKL